MIIRSINYLASIFLFLLGFFIPRTDNLWVVGGNKGLRYADNSMHFFRYCQKNTSRRVIWLTRSPSVLKEIRSEGYEAYLVQSLHGIWLGMRAHWHIFDVGPADTGPTSRGALRLNLWHGIPLKDISFLKRNNKNTISILRYVKIIMKDKSKEYFSHPNKKYIKHILNAFELHEKNIFTANLPRNATLISSEENSLLYLKPLDLQWREQLDALRSQGKYIIGYFPTWRSNTEDKFLGIVNPDALNELDQMLEYYNITLVTKWHTCSYGEYRHSGYSRAAEKLEVAIKKQKNIISLDFSTDLNSLLNLCDVLVTDYSSVLFDFLLTGRPQYFLPYDLEEYRNDFGLLFEYESFVPGPVFFDAKEMILDIAMLFEKKLPDKYYVKRNEMRRTFFEEESSSERIIALMDKVSEGK